MKERQLTADQLQALLQDLILSAAMAHRIKDGEVHERVVKNVHFILNTLGVERPPPHRSVKRIARNYNQNSGEEWHTLIMTDGERVNVSKFEDNVFYLKDL
jgi:hypothetical protein